MGITMCDIPMSNGKTYTTNKIMASNNKIHAINVLSHIFKN